MSTEGVIKDLIETLEDGRKGFESGAEKLAGSDRPDWARTFRQYSEQRARFAAELRDVAASHSITVHEDGSALGALHRGWMALKDAIAGDDPEGVLDAAEQGEDHAVGEYESALGEELPADVRTLVERQYQEVCQAHDVVKRLRDAADAA